MYQKAGVNLLHNQVVTKVKLFCPRVGKPTLPSQKLIAACNPKRGCSYPVNLHTQEPFDLGCPNPLQGQVVTLEEIPVLPIVLLPKYAGGKLSGYGINLFLLYAKKYRFIPKIKLATTVGGFMPHNKSFTPGSVRNASHKFIQDVIRNA